MTQFYSVNFSRLPQNSSLASTGYEILLYRGQNPFKEEEFELCFSAGFSGHKKHGYDSTVFVNSFGNAVFRVAPLVDQVKRLLDQSIIISMSSKDTNLSKLKPA